MTHAVLVQFPASSGAADDRLHRGEFGVDGTCLIRGLFVSRILFVNLSITQHVVPCHKAARVLKEPR